MVATCPPQPAVTSYRRREPELSDLHRIVRQHWPALKARALAETDGQGLPDFVSRAFERYIACGQLAHGFSRVRCKDCGDDRLVAFSCKVRGLCPSCDGKRMTELSAHLVDTVLPKIPVRQWVFTVPFALRYLLAWNAPLRSAVLAAFLRAVEAFYKKQARAQGVTDPRCGAVSVVQRFNSALQLNVHWHVLFADGVWEPGDTVPGQPPPPPKFHGALPLLTRDVMAVLADAQKRVLRQLHQRGLFEDMTVADDDDKLRQQDPALAACLAASLLDRQAVGDDAGQAILRLQSGAGATPKPHGRNCSQLAGFSLHANTRVPPLARAALEKLCKYICRPAIAKHRIELLDDDQVRVWLKSVWADGTAAKVMSGEDFVVRMAAVIPMPRCPILRYHGVFAPNASLRASIVPGGARVPQHRTGKRALDEDVPVEPEVRRTRMLWADALKRAFREDVMVCKCGGRREVIATITQPEVVTRILTHLGLPLKAEGFAKVPRRSWPDDLGEPPDPGWSAPPDDSWRDDVPELAA